MAFTCGFFNSENGDRKYNAEQMSAIFDGIIADGVFTTIGDHMAVSAGTGMQVLVCTGKAWFDHTWNVNDAAYPLAIAASDVTLSRIDAIVLETNHSDSVRLNKLRVVQGTVASSPVKPTLTNSEKVHQHPLAWVTVAPGVTQIAASAIENAVGTAACPFVTGIIATTAIDDLFNQWNGEFDEWFDNLKAQLSDNVVANLQKQIDANKTAIAEKVNKTDKATTEGAIAGTNDSTWMTPAKTKNAIDTQVPIILKSQWKTLINSTVNLPSQSSGTTNLRLYGQIQMNTIPISTILNAKKLHVEYSASGNITVVAKSMAINMVYLTGLWGILFEGGVNNNSDQLNLIGNVSQNETVTWSLDNIRKVNEYPIYLAMNTSNSGGVCYLMTPYGILLSNINRNNPGYFSNINFTMNITNKYAGVSGGRLNLTIHYKEDL